MFNLFTRATCPAQLRPSFGLHTYCKWNLKLKAIKQYRKPNVSHLKCSECSYFKSTNMFFFFFVLNCRPKKEKLCVQTGSGAHPASYPMGIERGKARPGRDADHSPPSSAEVKYE
jgi:hypothetical protein